VPCLDTTVFVDLTGRGGAANKGRVLSKLNRISAAGGRLTTTLFTVAELWVGVERSTLPEKEKQTVETLLAPVTLLDFDRRAAETFGRITAHLQKSGQPAGDIDVLIASVALVHGQVLVTRNPKHFTTIPALVVEVY